MLLICVHKNFIVDNFCRISNKLSALADSNTQEIFDIAILVSGDGDFVPAVNSVKKKGKFIKNIYFKNSSSRNLKNFCDESSELTKDILDRFFDQTKTKEKHF